MAEHPETPVDQEAEKVPETRREWELTERIVELERDLLEHIERERVRELEILSLRHELELRFAYNAQLEGMADDRQADISWLRSRVEFLETQHARSTTERVVGSLKARARRYPLVVGVVRRLRRLYHSGA